MSGATYILAINLLVAGFFCATFVAIACYAPRYRSARWFAAAYAMGVVYAVIEFLIPAFSDTRVPVFLGHTSFVATLFLLNIGIARRYDLEAPRNLLTATVAISMVLVALIIDLPRDSLLRLISYQAPYAAMQALGMTIVLRAPNRRAADRWLAGFLGVSALHYLAKPLVAVLVGGAGARAQDYIGTTYAMISQAIGSVLIVATGLLLLAMLIADLLRDITERSETDPLANLFNRRGFERRLGDCIGLRATNGLPLTLVLADLDHFKRVNDSFGHAVGDRLIAAFAMAMRKVAAEHHVLGRIGGEEFAVVLPGSNLAAGRLFAEAVRAAYAAAAAVHVPSTIHCSASFGVAEIVQNETAASLMERADGALYAAKRDGRDAVRVARPATVADPALGGNQSRHSLPR
jgi:diguanylate cyclase (GGDEF)-like protein